MSPWLAAVLSLEAAMCSAILAEAAHDLRKEPCPSARLALVSGWLLLAATGFLLCSKGT
ncbi:hypothetical protein GOFOIKOB_3021 [Methylobacterium tardum]|uniref:hypothetical protein n=1 Tax=Methylobacterium tardum TaxID=374432 RepID=UPI001EE06EF9|nr:hypothetical protein [Methylobacterium tardum]URD38363.1 hypothetical protein M6G65_07940 [Methylobacterium tardum]GJE49980.1 hypothetical protein GOFOIKOB_3021 [Methylobacterium tardum]